MYGEDVGKEFQCMTRLRSVKWKCKMGNGKCFVRVGVYRGSALNPYMFSLIIDEITTNMYVEILWCMMFANNNNNNNLFIRCMCNLCDSLQNTIFNLTNDNNCHNSIFNLYFPSYSLLFFTVFSQVTFYFHNFISRHLILCSFLNCHLLLLISLPFHLNSKN